MKKLSFLLFFLPALSSAFQPRFPFPKTSDEVWQNDRDLSDHIADKTDFFGTYISSATSALVASPGSTQWFDVILIPLTAGDWDITGVVDMNQNGATISRNQIGISTTSGNNVPFQGQSIDRADFNVTTNNNNGTIPNLRFSLTTSATVYLKASFDFSAGTPKALGFIHARKEAP